MPASLAWHASRMFVPRNSWVRNRAILLTGFALAAAGAQAQRRTASYTQIVLTIQQEIESNHLDDARALLVSAFRQYPDDGGLENLSGIVDIQQGQVDQAKQAFSEAILHSPKLSGAYLNLARIDMQSAESDERDRNQAQHLYEKVLQMNPGNAEANFEDAVLLAWERKYETSLQHLAQLDAEARKQVRAEALLCEDEAVLGHREAADRAAEAMAANPNLTEEDAMSVLPALRAAHRADLLDVLFTAADKQKPLSAGGLRILGLAEEAEGKPEQARATLERVFAMNPSDAAPLVDLTRIAVESKDYRGALGYLAHARALRPDDASLAYEFGVICLKLDLLGEATRAMGEAVRLAPDNPDYNFGMGTLSSFAQDPSQALPYLKKYHELRPDDPAGILALGTAFFRNKDFDQASVWLTQAAGDPSTAATARYYLGRVLRAKGQYDEAIAQLEESERLKPGQPEVFAELGQVYLQMRNYGEAEKQLNRAIALDANSYAANFALLQLYAHNHDPRLEEQSKKFEAIQGKNEAQYQEAMRVIEIRPQNGSPGSTP